MDDDVSTTHGYIPNNQKGVSYYIHDGLYATAPLYFTVRGGALRVGVRKDVAVANDWTIFDDIRLHYLGPLTLGDVNGDGNIGIADVTALVNIILGKTLTPSATQQLAADVNGDTLVNIADVTALVNIILGKK